MKNAREGQVVLYLLLVLVAVFLLALLGVDVFLAVRTKNHLQSGGDAAALAAARRQGELINEIGRLNIEHLKAAMENDAEACAKIELKQRRLALLEPVRALRLASAAAERNGLPENDDFTRILENHLSEVRFVYTGATGEDDPYPESYPGAWTEYANTIAATIAGGLHAGADNIEFYKVLGDHLLLQQAFYKAIAGADWCWFHFNCENVLNNYTSYTDWGPLPSTLNNSTENSEIFSLHLDARRAALTDFFTQEEIAELLRDYGGVRLEENAFESDNLATNDTQTWFFFSPSRWGMWFDGRRLAADAARESNGGAEAFDFPILGGIKDAYNVRGCAAVCRTLQTTTSFSTDTQTQISWNAAAKPFGSLGERAVTDLRNFVVPCMTDVRLVGVDMVDGESLATADYDWIMHVRKHLPEYIVSGPRSGADCWYCQQLKTWERASFHSRGKNWLRFHAGECVQTVTCNCCGKCTCSSGGVSHGH